MPFYIIKSDLGLNIGNDEIQVVEASDESDAEQQIHDELQATIEAFSAAGEFDSYEDAEKVMDSGEY